MKKSNILLTLGIVTAVGAGTGVGYGMYKDHLARKAHDRAVSAQVERYKACPDEFRARRSCNSEADRSRLQTEAEHARDGRRWEEAALKFIEIGMDDAAKEMIGRCDRASARRLRELLSIRTDAIEALRLQVERGLPFGGGLRSTVGPSPSSTPFGSAGAADAGPAAQQGDAGVAQQGDAGPAGTSGATAAAGGAQQYLTSTNPFQLDSRLQVIATGLSGDNRAKVQAIFDMLHVGGTSAVTVMDMSGRAPRTASEALAQGGDCTDLASVVIAILRQASIPGGALVLHFDGSPPNLEHMVPYAELDGRRIIIDLQAGELGQTAQGHYVELLTLTYDQAAFMYHREQAEYYADHGLRDLAIASYRRAIEIFGGDGHTHQNLGIMLEQARDAQGAAREFRRAAELDPRYAGERARGTYNEEVQAAQQAFRRHRWREAEGHYMNALTSGETITERERRTIEENIARCRRNAQR